MGYKYACYFVIWVHEEDRRIVTYAEGDLSEIICPDQEGFIAEIRSIEAFYGPAPPAFRVIDRSNGQRIKSFDKRPMVDSKPF